MKLSDHVVRLLVAITMVLAWSSTAGAMARQQDAMKHQVEPAKATESWKLLDETWTILEIGGSRIGWSSTVVEQAGDRIRTRGESKMEMNRGDQSIAIEMSSEHVETDDGRPVTMQFTQNMSAMAVKTHWEFVDGKVQETTSQGGRERSREFEAPDAAWLTPWKADQYAREQRKAGVEKFSVTVLDPQAGAKPITSESTLTGETEYEFNGEKVKVRTWKTISDINPVEAIEYSTADGELVFQEIPMGIGNIVMRKASKAVALQKHGDAAPEIMARSFAKPDKPIDNSMKLKRAKLRLTAKQGTLPELPAAGAQRVERSEDGRSAVLTIDIDNNLPAEPDETSSNEFVEASTMLDFDDELVQKLSNRAGDQSDVMARAEALRALVHRHISKKGMATAFATASETARTRTGDCSEHGVLLAALLRAQQIPSRVAMGLVYVDEFLGEEGIFGWHMWTQALIDGRWVDFDATLPVRYNAAHILTSTSSLADGMGASEMANLMQLLGNIDIEVLEANAE